MHGLWLEPADSRGLIILTNDTKASERETPDRFRATFALLLRYWLFFFFLAAELISALVYGLSVSFL